MTEWKDISTAPRDGRVWQVSERGDVRVDGRLLKQHTSDRGYKRVCFGKKTVAVHRLVAKAFLKPVDGKSEVNHLNGKKSDNRASNLEWCTRSENMKHAYRTGLHPGVVLRGKESPNWGRNGNSHPQSMPVRAIFGDGTFKDYESQGLAADDGFRPSKISMCINGKIKSHLGARWQPLPKPPESE